MIARSRLEPANTDQAGSGAHSVPKPGGLPVKAGESYSAPIPRKSTVSSDFEYGSGAERSACHAEGRGFESLQPLRNGVHVQAFLRAQSACASASCRTDSGLASGRSSAVPKKTPCLQAHSGSSEPKSFCGPAEDRRLSVPRPLGPPYSAAAPAMG